MVLNAPVRVVKPARTTYLYVDDMTEKRQSAALQRGPGDPMAIGEFGGAAALSDGNGTLLATPMYWFYELGHAALNPARAFADATRFFLKNPATPPPPSPGEKGGAATMYFCAPPPRRYRRPEWDIDSTTVGAERIPVHIKSVWQRPFCRLLHFERAFAWPPRRPQP